MNILKSLLNHILTIYFILFLCLGLSAQASELNLLSSEEFKVESQSQYSNIEKAISKYIVLNNDLIQSPRTSEKLKSYVIEEFNKDIESSLFYDLRFHRDSKC